MRIPVICFIQPCASASHHARVWWWSRPWKVLQQAVFACMLSTLAVSAAAQHQGLAEQIQQHQMQRQQQHQQQFQQSQQAEPHITLDKPAPVPASTLVPHETPCFPVHHIVLAGDVAEKFQFALDKALQQGRFQAGMCLGAQGINHFMTLTQNAVIDRGYTTTRILAAPQNLQSGKLEFVVLPGKVNRIRIDDSQEQHTHALRIAAFQNEFPIRPGSILNLRDIEQGLENMKRLPTAEADIQIVPIPHQPDTSDIVVRWQQRAIPYRVSLGLDDTGSKSTGKYQASLTLSADNPFGLSDMFYASYGRHIGHAPSRYNADGQGVQSRTHNTTIHYSVPWGNWLWSFNHSNYRYHQAVAGLSEVYDYNGRSRSSDIGFTRLLHRDATRKTHLTGKLWMRDTRSYINDAEVEVQRKKTGGWMLGIQHKEYIGHTTLGLALHYKRGTRLGNALPAAEEDFGEGTGKMKILTADADLNLPFALGQHQLQYDTKLHAQWNRSPLLTQDQIAIGGRNTVRGFDGEISLSAERGWYWRNELAWQYQPRHSFYIAADMGHVSGRSAAHLLGQTLAGTAIGLRGTFHKAGSLSYDLFIGTPLKKPQHFRTKPVSAGINIQYTY